MDSRESSTSLTGYPNIGREETDIMTEDLCLPEFRFSASYASRYNNCHGSANLPESIPGFIMPDKNELGMKGMGTLLHGIFAAVLLSEADLTEAALCLESLSQVWGKGRTELIKDEVKYITWWFKMYKTRPPINHEILKDLIQYVPKSEKAEAHEHPTPPRIIVHLAESLRYVKAITDQYEEWDILVEEKREAKWLVTAPKTTVDVVISTPTELHVLDLKMGDVPVDVVMNEQLMYYAQTFREYTHRRIVLHIMQRNNMVSWEPPTQVLDQWVIRMVNSERKILNGDLSLTPGSHCTFCPANPHTRGDKGNLSCPAMLQHLYGERDAAQSDIDVLEGD
jgi:hypothetical protein